MTKTVEITAAYREGQAAYQKDGAKANCPFPAANVQRSSYANNSNRVQWWNGFLDARTDDLLGHIFDKYGLGRMSQVGE